MSKLQRVIDAARLVSLELGDALEDFFAEPVIEAKGQLFPDTSRTIRLDSGQMAFGLNLRVRGMSFDVVEVSAAIQQNLFTERRGHEILGLAARYKFAEVPVNVVFRELPHSDVAGNAVDVRLIDAF